MESNQRRPLVAVVDDEIFVRRSMRRLVAAWGMDTAPFATAHDFIDMLEQFPSFQPDCVILDVTLPDASGLDVQREVRSLRPGVPIIILTTATDDQVRDAALAAGAAAVFRKPVDHELFIMALRRIVKRD